jgi:uncharacterized protein YjdB
VRIVKGTTIKLPVIAYPAANVSGKLQMTWVKNGKAVAVAGSSSASGKAMVKLGKASALTIKGVKKGAATVRVSVGGRTTTIQVTVVGKPTPAKKLTIRYKTVGANGAIFTARLSPAGATAAVPRWKSSRPSVASIDATGRLTAKKAGKTVITATVKGAKARLTIVIG